MSYRTDKLVIDGHTHTHTHAGNDNTRRPKLASGKNGVNFYFQVQFDLEDHRQPPHKTIGILIKVFYISDPNLVILAWTVDELSHGQAHDWRTDTHTHTRRQRQYPKANTGLG